MDKYFLKSKTLWGALVLLLSTLNVTLPVNNEEVSGFIDALQQIVGFVLVVWGRVSATKPIGFV